MIALTFRQMFIIRQFGVSFKRSLGSNRHGYLNLVRFNKLIHRKTEEISSISTYATNHNFSSITKETGYGSKYHPISPLDLAEEKMRERFFQAKSLTHKEWEEIKVELMGECFTLSETNFDSVVMNVILALNNYVLASSFMDYLKCNKQRPNFVTCLKFMSICSRNTDLCKQETILETFNKIKPYIDSSPVLDNTTVDYVIQGLSATDKWEESFEYLEKLLENNAKLDTKHALTSAAIRNGNIEMAWDMLNNWYSPSDHPANRVLKQYLRMVMKTAYTDPNEAELHLKRLFDYLVSKDYVIKMSLTDDIANFFRMQKNKWTVQCSKVDSSSICSGCGKSLYANSISAKDFKKLREAFLEKSLKKINVYFNTTDHELKSFLKFIEKFKPFDIVLDGLNAAHSVQGIKTKKTLALQLLKIIRHLSYSYGRILVLGRKHMREWPFHLWEQIQKNSFVFFASNISQDDPFLLYATLASGPSSVFLSSDLMRDHVANLTDPVLMKLFKHWQLSHQIYLSVDEEGEIIFTGPLKHHIQIQGSMNSGWHIPYDDEFILDPYEELNNWICIQRKTQ